MSRNAVETVMGAVVLVVAAVFLVLAYTTTQHRPSSTGYLVTASFDRVGGLRDGADVRVSGIKVGTVVSETLDPKTYLAIVRMSIDPNVQLKTDTVATITASGLLGDNYVDLIPGNEDEAIKRDGTGMIEHTTPPVDLWSLISQFAGSVGAQGGKGGESGAK